MSWRVVYVTRRCKLESRLGHLVIRAEDTTRIHLSEIAILIIESLSVSLTTALINDLIKRKTKVIFCDEKHSPSSELVPYYGSHDSTRALKKQLGWSTEIRGEIWAWIVRNKIHAQAQVLELKQQYVEAQLLDSYADGIMLHDASNREGHAAKVYFNALFGEGFSRHSDSTINSALDYGYTLLLSAFSREIACSGKITQLGIWHDNTFNSFNLSSDLMEPFRPLCDLLVCNLGFHTNDQDPLEPATKKKLLCLLDQRVRINGTNQNTLNAIRIYTQRVLGALDNEDIGLLPEIEYESLYENTSFL